MVRSSVLTGCGWGTGPQRVLDLENWHDGEQGRRVCVGVLFPVASETENGAQLGIAGQQDATRVGSTNRELGRLLYLRCKPRTASCQLPKPASARGFRSQGYAKSLLPRDQWPDSCSFGVAQHSFPRCSRTFNFRRKRNGTESTAATVAAWSGLRAPSHTRSAQGEVLSTPMVSTIRRGALTYELLQCKDV